MLETIQLYTNKRLLSNRNSNNIIVHELLVLGTLEIITANKWLQKNKSAILKNLLQWNIENIVMITIEYLEINTLLNKSRAWHINGITNKKNPKDFYKY